MVQEKFLIARNEWSARHILSRVRRGEILPKVVLFDSDKDAYARRSRMRPMQQDLYSIFKINWITKSDQTKKD